MQSSFADELRRSFSILVRQIRAISRSLCKMRRRDYRPVTDDNSSWRNCLPDGLDSMDGCGLQANPIFSVHENDKRQLEGGIDYSNPSVLPRHSSLSRESGGIRRNEGTSQENDSGESAGRITVVPFLHLGILPEGSKAPDTDAVEAVLDKAKDWYRYAPNCWIIYTKLTADTWTDRLRKIPGMESHAQFIIAELNLDNRSGWASQDVWDWLGKTRT
jgi:hypothetical protein